MGPVLIRTLYQPSFLAGMLLRLPYEGDAVTYCRIAIWFGSLFICITTILLSMICIVGLENYVSPYLHEHNTVPMPHRQERNRNGFVLLFDWSSALLKSAIVLCVFWLIDLSEWEPSRHLLIAYACLWQYTYFLAEVSVSSSYTNINNDAPTDAPLWHQSCGKVPLCRARGKRLNDHC